jgi:predicted dehydrogenase
VTNNQHQPCRVAIIGAGYTAREHARAFADVPGVVLAGIYSRTRARADVLAREYSIGSVCDSVAELYDATRADLVIVTVVETAMTAVSRTCLELPWSLLIEKPPGLDVVDATGLLDAARSSGRRVLVAFNRRFLSSTRLAAEQIESAAGPRFIKVQDQQNQAGAVAEGDPPEVVRNWMFANSIHTIDYFRIFGRGAVSTVEPVMPWVPDAPGVVVAKVTFESGDIGIYEGIWHAPGPWAISVTVPEQRWELRPLEAVHVQRLGSATTSPALHDWDKTFKPGFRLQAEHAVAAALGQPSDSVTLDDAVETMKLIGRIFHGARTDARER